MLFSYLALAPSVYAFARHQRKRVTLGESLVVALILCLVLASIGCGRVYAYVAGVEDEAVSFAATTFTKVFVNHDEEFLASNLKDEDRALTPEQFIARLNRELGTPLSIGQLEDRFITRWEARRLWVDGRFQLPVIYDSGPPVWINIEVSRIGDGWQIDHLGWRFKPRKI